VDARWEDDTGAVHVRNCRGGVWVWVRMGEVIAGVSVGCEGARRTLA
jgi:hypothetical protein